MLLKEGFFTGCGLSALTRLRSLILSNEKILTSRISDYNTITYYGSVKCRLFKKAAFYNTIIFYRILILNDTNRYGSGDHRRLISNFWVWTPSLRAYARHSSASFQSVSTLKKVRFRLERYKLSIFDWLFLLICRCRIFNVSLKIW